MRNLMQTSTPNPECEDMFQQQHSSSIMTTSTPNPADQTVCTSQVPTTELGPFIAQSCCLDHEESCYVSGNCFPINMFNYLDLFVYLCLKFTIFKY